MKETHPDIRRTLLLLKSGDEVLLALKKRGFGAGKWNGVGDAETDSPWHMFVYAYVADAWEGEPSESEEMRPKWFHVEDIPYGDMWDDDEFWLPYVLDNKKVVGAFTFNIDDKLLTHDVEVVEVLPSESA